jgi:hypothetical protein
MKLTTATNTSVDGVMQGLGAGGMTIQVYRPSGHPQYAPAASEL